MARLAAGVGLAGVAALGAAAVALLRGGARAAAPDYDLVITNARLVDGTGAAARPGALAIKGDRIAAVGHVSGTAARRLDVHGLMVAPGFIDLLGQSEMELLADGRAESKVRQGVTTEITGEGGSVAPVIPDQVREAQPWLDKHHVTIDWTDFDGYFRHLEAARPAINLGTFVGAAQVRRAVLGADNVAPTPE